MIVPQLVLVLFWIRSHNSEVRTGGRTRHVRPTIHAFADFCFLTSERQTACKPGSVLPWGRDGHSSGTPVARRLARPTRAAARKLSLGAIAGIPCRPYLALLPVGFAVPSSSPRTRVRSYRPVSPLPVVAISRKSRRSVLCGTVPGVAPAGHYPAPCFRGARTFLSRASVRRSRAAIRPSGKG
jgi:hypothetical protein